MLEKYRGCFVGLACGDAYGAPFEGGFWERLVWKFLGKSPDGRLRFTDDTQMTMDVAKSVLLNGEIDQQSMAQHFAQTYCWTRGYGPGAAHTLYLIRKGADWRKASRARFPQGSYGNGAAMRAPAVAMLFNLHSAASRKAIKEVAEITHAHPLAIEGAALITAAVQSALNEDDLKTIRSNLSEVAESQIFMDKLETAFEWLEKKADPSTQEIAKLLGNGIAAADSCVTAVYIALAMLKQPFERMLEKIAACGGDVDTIGEMAGAVWGARNGIAGIPSDVYTRVELYEEIIDLAERVFKFNQSFK